jgi:hypothetical protein
LLHSRRPRPTPRGWRAKPAELAPMIAPVRAPRSAVEREPTVAIRQLLNHNNQIVNLVLRPRRSRHHSRPGRPGRLLAAETHQCCHRFAPYHKPEGPAIGASTAVLQQEAATWP